MQAAEMIFAGEFADVPDDEGGADVREASRTTRPLVSVVRDLNSGFEA